MIWTDVVMVVMAVLVSLWLGHRATPLARIALWSSALLVSATMFMPSSVLRDWVGPSLLGAVTAALRPLVIDDMSHFLAFAWLGLVLWLLRPDLRGWRAVVVLVVLAIVGELVQGVLTVERSAHIVDVAINLLGSALGLGLALVVSKLAKVASARPGERKA